MSRAVIRIAGFGARDLARNRWLIAYCAFFLVATSALLRFSDTETKALLGLVNVVLFIVPVANIVFGVMYLTGAREFVELLLAQPLSRRTLYAGLFLGLTGPVAAAAVIGIGIPIVAHGASPETLRIGALMATLTIALSAIFSGLAAVIAYRVEDRVRGLAMALGIWLALAIVYDAAVLILATQFAQYPLERPMLAAMIVNPIDLARLILLLQFDVAALLGYTGAVFQRFFEGGQGLAIAGSAVTLWIAGPALVGARLFRRKDF